MIELTEQDIQSRLKNTEDSTVERKTAGDYRDCLKTAVGFSNSLPVVSDPTVFGMTGIGGASRPLPEREQERPRLSERLSPAPPQARYLWCRRAGPRALSLEPLPPCNYNGPHVSWQSPPHAQAGT